MGEHAAVYRRPAVVAAVDRRLTVEVGVVADEGVVELDLPQLRVHRTVAWDDVRAYTGTCREAWLRYDDDPGPDRFATVRGEDPAHLVLVALGEVDDHLRRAGAGTRPSLRVSFHSDIPLGSGFGSSAAAAVALVTAVLELHDAPADPDVVHQLVQEAERRQHGRPSGVDATTVRRGGLLWVERNGDTLDVEPLGTGSPHLGRFRLYQSGEPAETTGAVVAAVADLRRAEPVRIAALLDRMEETTRAFRAELASDDDDPDAVVALVRTFERDLETLGVVPAAIRDVIGDVEARGGSAKVSGAGSLRGPGAGSVLVYWPDGEPSGWTVPWEPLDSALGAEGVRVEADRDARVR